VEFLEVGCKVVDSLSVEELREGEESRFALSSTRVDANAKEGRESLTFLIT